MSEIVTGVQRLRLLVTHWSLLSLWRHKVGKLCCINDGQRGTRDKLALEYLGYNVYQFFTVINVIQYACGAFKVYPCVTDVWVLEFYPYQIKIYNK